MVHEMVVLLAALAVIAAPDPADIDSPLPADLVLRGGTIVTVATERPRVQALAARGEWIVALGSDAEVKSLIGPRTRVIDLEGRLVIPGFIEGHGHLASLGEARMSLDLTGARDWNAVIELVAEKAKRTPHGEWIIGDGWHQGRWSRPPDPTVEGYPLHTLLSRATPDHPVLLKHATGHMCFANSLAMKLAGIDRGAVDPPGGKILRDAAGEPTGAFRETAQDSIYRAREKSRSARSPEQRQSEMLQGLELAMSECLAKGVTSFQDAGSPFATIDL